MNFIHIAGHLGADPEVRFTSSGKKVTTFTRSDPISQRTNRRHHLVAHHDLG